MAKARRVKRERFAVGMHLNPIRPVTPPCVVLLTRCSPGPRPLDDDNLRGALKAVRDEVARWLRTDDGSSSIRWVYAQRRTRGWGVVIEVCPDDKESDDETQAPDPGLRHLQG